MQPNEQLKKVMKIFIFAFLCTEMRTSYTHRDGLTQRRHIEAEGKRAPFQASIRLKELEQDYYGKGHICAGALVASSVVLTDAHCLYNNGSERFYHPAELRVQLGSTQRFAPTPQSQLFGVTHVHRPPQPLALAILMLDRDVPAAEPHIQPIALSAQLLRGLYDMSSWGTTDRGQQELHEMLTVSVACEWNSWRTVTATSGYQLDAGAPVTRANELVALRTQSGFVEVASHADWLRATTGDGGTQNSSWWGILGLLVFTGYVLKCSSKSLLS
ncbi:hypothetical protein KR093_009474 [Drosophila rubida]|uniref:trypsin n=1 Tax=Drosophila rubida TaxID=30044 RepID=A0AAD4KBC6_9MUSC|nr:hypothetical protein KR093_009474 [Drosophila rubida]